MLTSADVYRVESVLNEIEADVLASAREGLRTGAAEVPRFIQRNIEKQGRRGGNKAYPRLTFNSIKCRETYPHGAGAAAELEYFRNHLPLVDTGALFDSFVPGRVRKVAPGVLRVNVTSTTNYGWKQEHGVGETCNGAPIRARPHMFLVVGDDTDVIDAAFARGFRNG